jgi:Kdo2-lipid IVA lauroyltransferase/acyltransferase
MIRPLAWLLARTPLSLAVGFAWLLSWTWWTLLPIRRRVAVDNLAGAFPDLPPGPTLRRSFRELVLGYVELLHLDRDALPGVRFEGHQALLDHAATGQGALLLAGHGGAWEIALTGAARVLHMPLTIMVRAPAHPGSAQLIGGLRGRSGAELLDPDGGFKALLRSVRAGRIGVVTLDQRQNNGTPLPFFGRPAWTSRGIGVLARRTGVPVFTVWQWRTGTGQHVVRFDGPLALPEDGDDATRTCLAWIEAQIRAHPHGWLWLHDRWKVPPEPEETP